MKEVIIKSEQDYKDFISENLLAAVYFSTPDCGVCKVLKPKIVELLNEEFPNAVFGYVDASEQREVAAQQSVFTVPTILFFAEGKEFLRESRNVDMSRVNSTISRIYNLIYT